MGSNGEGEVWVTRWGGTAVGDKPGLRTKYLGHDWQPAQFIIPAAPLEVIETFRKTYFGVPYSEEDFPEAVAVWNEKAFARKKDRFAAGGFYAVRGRTAEILAESDLGKGGLIPMPLFKADLETPWPEPCWWLNFGESKDSFVPGESKNLFEYRKHPVTAEECWSFMGPSVDYSIAVSRKALTGSDLWIERQLRGEIFLSGRLARALIKAKIKPPLLHMHRAKIVGDVA